MAKGLCPSKTYFFFFSLQNRVYVGLVVLKLHMLVRLQLKNIACLCLPSARSKGVPLCPGSKTDLKKNSFSTAHNLIVSCDIMLQNSIRTQTPTSSRTGNVPRQMLWACFVPQRMLWKDWTDVQLTEWWTYQYAEACYVFSDSLTPSLSKCLCNSGWLRNLKWHKLTKVCASVHYILVKGVGTVKESLWCQRAAFPQVPLKLWLML